MIKKILFITLMAMFTLGCQKQSKDSSPPPSVNTNPPATLSMSFDVAAQIVAGSCSSEHQVKAMDSNGALTNVVVDQVVRLSSSSQNVTFYSDSSCSKLVTSVKIKAGTSNSIFYIKSALPEYFTFTAATPNIQSDTQSHTAISSSAARLDFAGPSNVIAGVCSSQFTVKTLNLAGVESTVSDDTNIGISGMGTGRFYLTADCSGTAYTTMVVKGGQSSAKFYFKTTKVGGLNLTATAPGPITKGLFVSVKAGDPSQIVFLTSAQTIQAGACSSSVTVQYQDSFGNPAVLQNDSSISLAGEYISFFSNSSCSGGSVTSVPIQSNSSSGTFYLSSTKTEAKTIAVSGVATQVQSVNVVPAQAASLVLSPISSILTAGFPFTNLTAQVRDIYENQITGINRIYNATAYKDSGCTIPSENSLSGVTQLTTPGLATFSVMTYTRAEPIYIGVKTSGLNQACSGRVTVVPDFATKLKLEGPSIVKSGQCSSSFNIITADNYGNESNLVGAVSVSISGKGTGAFYSNSSCSGTPIESLTISENTSRSSFFFKGTLIESNTFSVSGLGNSTATFPVSVTAGSPEKITFTSPVSITAGSCASGFSITTKDINNNNAPVVSDTPINLTQSGDGSFYSDPSCVNPISSININKDTFSRQLYFKNNKIQNIIISATAYGKTETKSLSISPAIASKLNTSVPSFANAGAPISNVVVEIQDQFGNKQLNASSTINIDSYTDSACTISTSEALVGNRSVQAVSGSASFSNITYNKVETIYIKATSGSLTPHCSSAIKVSPNTASKLAFDLSNINFVAGDCSELILLAKDSIGNTSPMPASISVDLSSDTSGKFYSNSECSNEASQVVFQEASTSLKVYYIASMAGQNKVTASGQGLTSGTLDLLIGSGVPDGLSFTGPSEMNANSCSGPYMIKLVDSFGNYTASNIVINANFENSGEGSFYGDSLCNNQISGVRFSVGDESKGIYFRSQKAGTNNFGVVASDVKPAYLSGVIVKPLTPAKLAVEAQTTLTTGVCSDRISVSIRDSFDNLTNALENTLINIENPEDGMFFLSESCSGTPISYFTINKGEKEQGIYMKKNQASGVAFGLHSAGFESTYGAIEIISGVVSKLSFKNPVRTVLAGACSGTIEVVSVDAYGNTTLASSPIKIDLASSGVKYFASSNCLGNEISSITIPNEGSSVNFFVKIESVNTSKLNISSQFGEVDQSVIVKPNSPSKIKFSELPSIGYPGRPVFATPVVVSVSDAYGNTVTTDTSSISISAYKDSSCLTQANQPFVGITQRDAVSGRASFDDLSYTAAEPVYIQAFNPLFPKICSPVINITAVGPQKIVLSGPSSGSAGICSGPIYLTSKDFYNNPTPVSSNSGVELSGIGSLSFYNDNNCSNGISSSFNISEGSSQVGFYVKSNKSEDLILEATSSFGKSTLPFSILPLAPSVVEISGPSSFPARSCAGPFKITTKDSLSNNSDIDTDEIFSFTNVGDMEVYEDSSCSYTVSEVFMFADSHSKSFYLKGQSTGSVSFSISSQKFGSKSSMVNVTSPPPIRVAIKSSSQSVIAGNCAGPYTAELRDDLNSVSAAQENILVNLDGKGNGAFFSDSGCSSSVSSLTITTGLTSKQIWFKDTKAESLLFNFTSEKLQYGSVYPVTVNAGAPNSISYKVQPVSSVVSNQIIAPAVELIFLDPYQNRTYSGLSPITVSLEQINGDPAQTLSGGLIQTPNSNTGIASFSDLRVKKKGSYRLKAVGGGFTARSNIFDVESGPAKIINIVSGNNQELARGVDSAPLKVIVTDDNDNQTSANIVFKRTSGTGLFKSNSSSETIVRTDGITGIGESIYTTSTDLNSSSITATIEGTSSSVMFVLTSADFSPLNAEVSSQFPFEFYTNGPSYNVSSVDNIFSVTEALFSVSSNGMVAENKNVLVYEEGASPAYSLVGLTDLTNGQENVSIRIHGEYPSGATGGTCNFQPSSSEFIKTKECEVSNTAYTVLRSEITSGNIIARVFSSGSVVGPYDYKDTSVLVSNKYYVRKFKDLSSSEDSVKYNMVVVNNELFFNSSISNGNVRLFKTDGASVEKVSLINSISDDPQLGVASGSSLYFTSKDEHGERRLFELTGTTIKKVGDLLSSQGLEDSYSGFAIHDGVPHVSAVTGLDAQSNPVKKLFKLADGKITKITDVNSSSKSDNVSNITSVGTKLYFTASNFSGTTYYIYELSEGVLSRVTDPSNLVNNPKNLVSYNGNLFFLANNENNKTKMFLFDGNDVRKAFDMSNSTTSDLINLIGVCDGKMLLAAGTESSPELKLYSYDGATQALKQISNNRPEGSDFSSVGLGSCITNEMYFPMLNSEGKQKLFKLTAGALVQVSDLVTSGDDIIEQIISYKNSIFFISNKTSGSGKAIYRICGEKEGCSNL